MRTSLCCNMYSACGPNLRQFSQVCTEQKRELLRAPSTVVSQVLCSGFKMARMQGQPAAKSECEMPLPWARNERVHNQLVTPRIKYMRCMLLQHPATKKPLAITSVQSESTTKLQRHTQN